MQMRRGGAVLFPGRAVGDVVTWDGTAWVSAPVPPPPASTVVAGSTVIYQTVGGITYLTPASLLAPPAGARQMFDVHTSFAGIADGTLLTTNPDISGNALDLSNAGGAERPSLITDADGIRAIRFDGVANNFLRRGMAAVATPHLIVFLVARHFLGSLADVPWSLGRAGVLSSAAGCARGLIGAASGVLGAQANGLGGAIAQGLGAQLLDAANTSNPGGWYCRRAYCFRWGTQTAPGADGRWGMFGYRGSDMHFLGLDVIPPVNQFTFTALVQGAENNGGGALLNICPMDLSFMSYYEGATAQAISHRTCWVELERLRARFSCL